MSESKPKVCHCGSSELRQALIAVVNAELALPKTHLSTCASRRAGNRQPCDCGGDMRFLQLKEALALCEDRKGRMMTATTCVVVETPRPPNFLRLSTGGTVQVGDVSDETLRQVAADWLEALRRVAKTQQAQADGDE